MTSTLQLVSILVSNLPDPQFLSSCHFTSPGNKASNLLFQLPAFITLFVTIQHYGKSCNYCHEAFTIDRQWLWNHAIKFTRWQHPAMQHRARFAGTAPHISNC